MAALSYLKETEEGKERKSGLAAQARLFFLETLQTKIKPIELAARWACFVSDEMDQT